MMNEKDKQIERLFDDYASTIQPNTRLAVKAMEKLRTKQKPSNRRDVIWGSLAAVFGALFMAVFAVTNYIGRKNHAGNGGDIVPDSPPSIVNYSISEIKAQKVDASFAADYLNLDIPPSAQIFSENYYACYIKASGEFVYLKAVLGIAYNDGNIQMTVVAEKSNYKGKELAAEFEYLMRDPGYNYGTDYIRGEYVTMAYRKTNEYNYYVSSMGNVGGAESIAEILVHAD